MDLYHNHHGNLWVLLDWAWIWIDFADFKHDYIMEVYQSNMCLVSPCPQTVSFQVTGKAIYGVFNLQISCNAQFSNELQWLHLTHWGQVLHICAGRQPRTSLLQIIACRLSGPSHYLNQCWNIVNWTLGNKLQWSFNRNLNISIQENAFENVCCGHFVSASMC